jgi:hypothetical protein
MCIPYELPEGRDKPREREDQTKQKGECGRVKGKSFLEKGPPVRSERRRKH